QAQAASSTGVTLEWESSAEGVTGFRIERSTGGGDFEEVAEVGPATATYTDTGLAAGTPYHYRIWALGSSGDLECSGDTEVTTRDLGTVPLEALAMSSSGVDLSWVYTAGDAQGFRIERKTAGTDFTQEAELDAGQDSYSDTGLSPETGYTYRVWAFNDCGDVACSEEVSVTTGPSTQPVTEAVIIDHACIDLDAIPQAWITRAKEDLHIAYGHTSHGSQLTTGMTGLADWKGDLYAYSSGGSGGALDLRDTPFSGASDLGNPDREAWAAATRTYLDDHPEVNVIIWSWCGQADTTEENIDLYLSFMDGLEQDYPEVRFVYMTGHLTGSGTEGNLNLRNEQIRQYCRDNGKVLYDFADIESYDPEGNEYLSLYADDGCNYDSDGDTFADANWAQDWQASHTEGVDWYDCSSAHSEPVNANMKAYAAWWLWARLAGWDGP
ncbi:MAG: fibronectin type III domain-containing protein, partial [Desulfobacterota bacterium]|nr:fibronectin type III domain-containing protein [Thermodesulfobacteriota bacterium]